MSSANLNNLSIKDLSHSFSNDKRNSGKKLVFIKEMVQVGISKKYPVLKFILLIINQLKALVIFHFQIL